MEKEEAIFQKHIMDLSRKAYQNHQYTFSGFLSMPEQDSVLQLKDSRQLLMNPDLYGGCEQAERRMVRFGSMEEFGYEEEFPITGIYVKPLIEKFADTLSHRDVLGALMHLGIERSTIGDIFVDDKSAYIYCTKHIAPYILQELCQIKHTHVSCIDQPSQIETVQKDPFKVEIIVSSLRVDGVVAGLYHMSRSRTLDLFREKKVFLNGRICENNSYLLKECDQVSVRGFGKFTFIKEAYHTRKDKFGLSIEKYE